MPHSQKSPFQALASYFSLAAFLVALVASSAASATNTPPLGATPDAQDTTFRSALMPFTNRLTSCTGSA
jgi:hypothetical protein